MPLIVQMILLVLALGLSVTFEDKTQRFILSTLQLINGISSDLQKLLGYFNGKGIAKFLEIPFAWWPSVSPNNLALNMEDLKRMSAIFYQILFFSPNNSPSKIMKKVFNFIEKALFVLEIFKFLHFFLFSWDIQVFAFFPLPFCLFQIQKDKWTWNS